MRFFSPNLYLALSWALVILLVSNETTGRRRSQGRNRPFDDHQQQSQFQDTDLNSTQILETEDYGEFDPNPVETTSSVNEIEDDDDQQRIGEDPEAWSRYSENLPKRRHNRPNIHYTRPTPRPRIPQTTSTAPTADRNERSPARSLDDIVPQVVTDKKGTFKGKVIKTAEGKTVVAFLGIPFAKPPVNDLRFKKPVPMNKLEEPFDATHLPNSCIQLPTEVFPGHPGEQQWNPNTNVSEDCLYLNIWIPASVFQNKEVELVAVMYWIYGGGFYSGSSTLDIYNGAVLASENEVVVVSSQYRLGPLGFLYFGIEDAPGNVGMLDQVLALKWTNENIRHFGGDPDSVTLIGESAGAAAVTLHSLSSLSRSYFKRSVILSGLATAKWAVATPDRVQQSSIELAKLAGCDTQKSEQEIVTCLRGTDATKLAKLQLKFFEEFMNFPFKPTVDGYFLTDMPINILNSRNAKRHEIVIGTDADEGSYFALYHYLPYFHEDRPTSVSFDKYISIMREIFQDFSDFERDLIIDYYTNWENPNDGYLNQKIISQAIGDYYFTCPIRQYADIWSNRGLKVYFFQFTQRTSSNPWGEWMGVMHSDELEYLFGVPLTNSSRFTPGEVNLSRKIQQLFTTFAKTGNPSNNWERYTSEAPLYVELNATKISDSTYETRYGPEAQNCAFWNEMLPNIKNQIAYAAVSSQQEENKENDSNENELDNEQQQSSCNNYHHQHHFHHNDGSSGKQFLRPRYRGGKRSWKKRRQNFNFQHDGVERQQNRQGNCHMPQPQPGTTPPTETQTKAPDCDSCCPVPEIPIAAC